jgi:hypothetical protein
MNPCYKIITFDNEDDVIDTFASLHNAVATIESTYDYNNSIWKKFYKSLELLFQLENDMYAASNSKKQSTRMTGSVIKNRPRANKAATFNTGKSSNSHLSVVIHQVDEVLEMLSQHTGANPQMVDDIEEEEDAVVKLGFSQWNEGLLKEKDKFNIMDNSMMNSQQMVKSVKLNIPFIKKTINQQSIHQMDK